MIDSTRYPILTKAYSLAIKNLAGVIAIVRYIELVTRDIDDRPQASDKWKTMDHNLNEISEYLVSHLRQLNK
jgi:hypothetical protein